MAIYFWDVRCTMNTWLEQTIHGRTHRKADAHLAIAKTSVLWRWLHVGLCHFLIGFRICKIRVCCCFLDPLMVLGFLLTAFHATFGILAHSGKSCFQDTKQKLWDFPIMTLPSRICFLSDHLIETIALIETKEISTKIQGQFWLWLQPTSTQMCDF